MRYPIAIELGNDMAAFGVVVPDLPGCFSAGDTFDEAIKGAKEAAAAWIDATLDAGHPIPAPSSLETIRQNPDFAGWTIIPAAEDIDRSDGCLSWSAKADHPRLW